MKQRILRIAFSHGFRELSRVSPAMRKVVGRLERFIHTFMFTWQESEGRHSWLAVVGLGYFPRRAKALPQYTETLPGYQSHSEMASAN